jgi:quinol-cytochrome oxidoreductase complex cytochrome b subunit
MAKRGKKRARGLSESRPAAAPELIDSAPSTAITSDEGETLATSVESEAPVVAVESEAPVVAVEREAPPAAAPVERPVAPAPPSPRSRVSDDAPLSRSGGLTAFFLHLHPRAVRRRSAGLSATLGLGLATAVSLGIATISGLALLVYYVPSVERAHASVQDLISVVFLGRFLRNLHRWSAHASVALALLHLLRTFIWGSYRGQHRRVWLLGVGLLLATAATSYSGYLLPWDQDAYWTVTVGTSLVSYLPAIGDGLRELLLGGPRVGQEALTRFFVLHVLALPAVGLVLLVLHLFRLRRAGGLARPPGASGADEELVPASPHLTTRELTLTLIVTGALVLLAVLVDARLGPPPDLLRPDNPPKAPWFLVGLQELVAYSATIGGVIFPLLLVGGLAAGPWLDGRADNDGAPIPGRAPRIVVGATSLLTTLAAVGAVRWWGDPQLGQASWINPATIVLAVIGGAAIAAALLARGRTAAFQALLAGLLAAMLVFTVIGWFGRGVDWRLAYHPGPARGASPLRLAVTAPSEIVQITTPAGEVDRCPTCHRATLPDVKPGDRSPLRAHPPVAGHPDLLRFGCTSCHGGQGRRLDAEAHAPLLGDGPNPFLRSPHAQARCVRCHVPTGLRGAVALEQGLREYLDAGCSGCHQPGRRAQGLGPDLRRLGRRSEAELRQAILDPQLGHASAVMWGYRWRYDQGTTPGRDAVAALITALLSFAESTAPYAQAWASPTLRVDVDCASCHTLERGGRALGRAHRCTLLREQQGLRCPSCHDARLPPTTSPATRPATSPRRECPQIAAARPGCAVCHLRSGDGAPRER